MPTQQQRQLPSFRNFLKDPKNNSKSIPVTVGKVNQINTPYVFSAKSKNKQTVPVVVGTAQQSAQQSPVQQFPVQQSLAVDKSYQEVVNTPSKGHSLSSALKDKLYQGCNQEYEDEPPSFFDGAKYLSKNVDFQLFKGYNSLTSAIPYDTYTEVFFEELWNSLTPKERKIIKGGLFNSGKGKFAQDFCTYRYVLKTKKPNPEDISNLIQKLLKGINITINKQKIHIPALLAPTHALYQIRVVRVSQLAPDLITDGFGKYVFENVIKNLNGFQNSKLAECFVTWNTQHHFKHERLANLDNLYLLLTDVDNNNALSEAYYQANFKDGTFMNFTLMQFGFCRQLIIDHYLWTLWDSKQQDQQHDFQDDEDMDDSDISQAQNQGSQPREKQNQDNTISNNNSDDQNQNDNNSSSYSLSIPDTMQFDINTQNTKYTPQSYYHPSWADEMSDLSDFETDTNNTFNRGTSNANDDSNPLVVNKHKSLFQMKHKTLNAYFNGDSFNSITTLLPCK
eukprot:TRINITY_DN1943_c0_g2_i1.p2 TRINITY_DN1943_c0_g2~~TRINITY_DN1943_c0_g2_i1.p2  ORF type:complete len:507 (-),score=26.33 TRINITY_DN1943_c0_g2_i1:1400-2920(-)